MQTQHIKDVAEPYEVYHGTKSKETNWMCLVNFFIGALPFELWTMKIRESAEAGTGVGILCASPVIFALLIRQPWLFINQRV